MSKTVNDLALSYLHTLCTQGIQTCPVDDDAREILRSWFRAAKQGKRTAPTEEESQHLPQMANIGTPLNIPEETTQISSLITNSDTPKPHTVTSKDNSSYEEKEPTLGMIEQMVQNLDEGDNYSEEFMPHIPQQEIIIPQGTPELQWEALKKTAQNWIPAKSLGTLRPTLIFGTGSPTAQIMIIGEAPGTQEEKNLTPFVGPAGEKLNQILTAMGLNRDELYLTNVVKFRPALPQQTENNRRPSSDEIEACLPLLYKEIDIIQPKILLVFGEQTAQILLHSTLPLTELRGQWHHLYNIPLRATYHPRNLLLTGDNKTKRLLWEDMLATMEKLNLPISAKQQNFFLPKN